jgi:hypothetical protein
VRVGVVWERVLTNCVDAKRWNRFVPGWTQAVANKSDGVMDNIFGFVDVNCRPVCRPRAAWVAQRYFYSGCLRCHALKFLGITAPRGIPIGMMGSCPGSRADSHVWMQTHQAGARNADAPWCPACVVGASFLLSTSTLVRPRAHAGAPTRSMHPCAHAGAPTRPAPMRPHRCAHALAPVRPRAHNGVEK